MNDKVITITLAGNPNVGKSTLFNNLTGLNQHTGNWSGKTVDNAFGEYSFNNKQYRVYDLPGTYSLVPSSKEEIIARDFICFEKTDLIIIVCDATCLEKNLNLVIQTLELNKQVIVCINLNDEAIKKGIIIDKNKLESYLKVPIILMSAKQTEDMNVFMSFVDKKLYNAFNNYTCRYTNEIETHLSELIQFLKNNIETDININWLAINLISGDKYIYDFIMEYLNIDLDTLILIDDIIMKTNYKLSKNNINIGDMIINSINDETNKIIKNCVTYTDINYKKSDIKYDKLFTSKKTGIPIMILMLMFLFFLTITFSNIPSELLMMLFSKIEIILENILEFINFPHFLTGFLIDGIYKTVTWIVAVMLPPMLIFFPLFTLLEDVGYLPRIAFNLDNWFQKCGACGKQALTMCMGIGCNAVGVVGCRIIDSPRERLIAIITNNFMPCNGRFPILISTISIFFTYNITGFKGSIIASFILTALIASGILMTFIVSKFLSITLLKGKSSTFVLELPPYRKPEILSVLIRSILDRALFILKRAVVVAVPAGVVIYLLANININDLSILSHLTTFLDPMGKLFGMDGVILLAFILGIPAKEIVIPVMIMCYANINSLTDMNSLDELRDLLLLNGWTIKTAICTLVFTMFHFPCTTTLLTIKNETGSLKWMFVSFIIPTLIGLFFCCILNIIL